MAHQRMGDPEKAKGYYEQALRWQVQPPAGALVNRGELQSFQAETETLLGIRASLPSRDPQAGPNLINLEPDQ